MAPNVCPPSVSSSLGLEVLTEEVKQRGRAQRTGCHSGDCGAPPPHLIPRWATSPWQPRTRDQAPDPWLRDRRAGLLTGSVPEPLRPRQTGRELGPAGGGRWDELSFPALPVDLMALEEEQGTGKHQGRRWLCGHQVGGY